MQLHDLVSARRRVALPEVVDQAIDAERLSGVDQQIDQQAAPLPRRQLDRLGVIDLERAEDPELHAPTFGTPKAGPPKLDLPRICRALTVDYRA